MTTRFDTKDPGEDVTVEFDFALAGVPTSPVVELEVIEGADPTPEAIRLGSPAIVGSKVFQRITAGVAGVDYGMRCFAVIGSDTFLIDGILPVRRRPRPTPAA